MITPVGFIAAGGAFVAWTAAVGTAVAWGELPVDGADVAGTAVACGADVGEVDPLSDCGVAVADEPQANNKATNNRTMAFGRFLETIGLSDGCRTYFLLILRITYMY